MINPKDIANLMEDESNEALAIVHNYLLEKGYYSELSPSSNYIRVIDSGHAGQETNIHRDIWIAIDNPQPGVIQVHNEEWTVPLQMSNPDFFDKLIGVVDEVIADQRRLEV